MLSVGARRAVVVGLTLLPLPAALVLEHRAIDPIRYFSMARRFAETGVYGRDVKERFLDDTAVSLNGPTEFAPLYPLVGSLVVRLHGDLHALQALNVLLVAAALLIIAGLASRLAGAGAGLLAVALWTAWPDAFWLATMGWNEPLALLLTALILTASVRASAGPLQATWLGTLVGVGFLARPELALLAPGLAVYRAWTSPRGFRRGLFVEGAPLLFTAVLITTGIQTVQLAGHGDRLLSQAFLYRATTDQAAFVGQLTLPGPVGSLLERSARGQVLPLVADKAWGYGRGLAAATLPAALLGVGYLLTRRRTARASPRPGVKERAPSFPTGAAVALFGIPAVLILLLHVATWSVPVLSRYLALPFFIALPPLAAVVTRALDATEGRRRTFLTVLLAFGLLLGFARYGYLIAKTLVIAQRQPSASFLDPGTEWSDPDAERTARILADRVPAGATVAAANPWLLNYLSGLPAVNIPDQVTPAVERAGHRLRLAAWVDSPYAAEPAAWPREGMTVERVGEFKIHICGTGGCAIGETDESRGQPPAPAGR